MKPDNENQMEKEYCTVEKELGYLSNIIDNLPEAIVCTDTEGKISMWNKGASELFGYSSDELIGKKFTSMLPENLKEKLPDLLDITNRKGYLKGVEELLTTKEGGDIAVEMIISMIKDQNGSLNGYNFILKDITPHKEMERELFNRQEQLIMMTYELEKSNALKDLFTDIMRHDLLNPAGVIRNYADLGLMDDEDDEILSTIYKNSNKLIKMIENASTFSKLESQEKIQFEDLNLKEVLDEVYWDMKPVYQAANMELIFENSLDIPVKANPMVEDIFINFLTNASKYAHEGEKVILKTEENEDAYRISVIDFGEGIADEHKQNIFNRFHRKRKEGVKGTGLGLAIVKRLIDIHGWDVRIEDNPEGGAVFVVEIPKGP